MIRRQAPGHLRHENEGAHKGRPYAYRVYIFNQIECVIEFVGASLVGALPFF